MSKSTTKSYVVSYELKFDEANPMSVLSKLDKIAVDIYNTVLREGLKRLHKVQHDRIYQSYREEYVKLLQKKKLTSVDKKIKNELSKQMNEICKDYGFAEYDLYHYVVVPRHHFHNQLGAHECQKLASIAFKALQNLRFGKAEKVHFKKRDELISITSKDNTTGIRFDRDTMSVRYKSHSFPIIIKPNDQYAQIAFLDRVKYVQLMPKRIRGKVRWFANITFEGIPPQKENHVFRDEETVQGIDIGVSTVAVVNEHEAHLYELAEGCNLDMHKKRIIERKMDRSRRVTNPDNYNADGTVKKGRHTWKQSNAYKKLKAKLAEISRKITIKRKQEHEMLANKILASGTDIRVESMSFKGLQKRSKNITRKSNGRINSKKRFGKTIQSRAPAMLLSILNRKLGYIDSSIKKVNTAKVKASQYNPLTKTYQRKELKDRMIQLKDGTIVQRDMLSAYILANTNSSLASLNKKKCLQGFDNFKRLQDSEIQRLRPFIQKNTCFSARRRE